MKGQKKQKKLIMKENIFLITYYNFPLPHSPQCHVNYSHHVSYGPYYRNSEILRIILLLFFDRCFKV